MEAVGIAGALVGITTAAIHSVQFLTKTIANIKENPNTVKDISTDLRAIQPILQSLAQALQNRFEQIVLTNQVRYAIKNYNRACIAFQSRVEH